MITQREKYRFGMIQRSLEEGNLSLVETRDAKGIRRVIIVRTIESRDGDLIMMPIAKMLSSSEVNMLMDPVDPRKVRT